MGAMSAINKAESLKRQRDKKRKEKQQKAVITGSVPYSQYADKPIEFTLNILKITPTIEQQQILISVRDRSITNVKAAHGVGKSLVSACIVLWWVFAVGGQAITTAPTESQVKQILWKEVRRLYDRHKKQLGGVRGELFVRFSESARAYGFTSKNYDSNSFQGKHDEYLLLIQDEADGITEVIDDGFRSCLTGSKNRGLRIGNPLDCQSPFAKSCAADKYVQTISAWNHPNIAWAYKPDIASLREIGSELHKYFPTGIHRLKPEIAALILDANFEVIDQELWNHPLLQKDVIPGAISIKWIEDVRKTKFEASGFWMSRVEGIYADDCVDGIIPLSYLLDARHRYDANPEYWDNEAAKYPWRLGLDVGDGGDNNALAVIRGSVLYGVTIRPTVGDRLDTDRAATLAKDEVKLLGGEYSIAVDNTGVGAGTLTTLLLSGYSAAGCKFGESASNKQQYVNLKTELMWTLRELLRKEEFAIAPLGDEEKRIFEELSATRYTTNTKEQIVCESKDTVRKRLKRSPDAGDAVIIAFSARGGNSVYAVGVEEDVAEVGWLFEP
ncbi:MAG: hypothetical protein HC815_19430 [Richelia sp. RM1_1_1]|nr:hypothetical protein [Richelia sp. RM1_1_1]